MQAAVEADPLDLLEIARRRCLDEIEFHQQEKDRHVTRINQLRLAFGTLCPEEPAKTRRRGQQPVEEEGQNSEAEDERACKSIGRLIMRFLKMLPARRATVSEIELHLADVTRPAKAGVALARLLEDGKIRKMAKGVYGLFRRKPYPKGRFDADDGENRSVGRHVVEFLKSRPDLRATTSEIETHLSEIGRPCKPGVALTRLLEEKKVRKVARGVYELIAA
jgi:hypothetical protein